MLSGSLFARGRHRQRTTKRRSQRQAFLTGTMFIRAASEFDAGESTFFYILNKRRENQGSESSFLSAYRLSLVRQVGLTTPARFCSHTLPESYHAIPSLSFSFFYFIPRSPFTLFNLASTTHPLIDLHYAHQPPASRKVRTGSGRPVLVSMANAKVSELRRTNQ